jgi:hypothetical protein
MPVTKHARNRRSMRCRARALRCPAIWHACAEWPRRRAGEPAGRFDSIIHNAALGYREPRRIETVDGLPHVLAINTLAPYVLTALIDKPRRLIYLSSGLHRSGDASLDDLEWRTRRWDGTAAYSDSKLHDVLLAFAIARRWPDVLSNARSNRAGSRRRWAAPARPTISTRRRAPRSGSRPATIPRRASAGSTSII